MPKILVVDDSEMNRDMLSRRLKKSNYEVDTAGDGLQALAKVASKSYDLILLDIMMPRMDGFEVLQKLKSNPSYLHIPVIVISAVGGMESAVKCIEMGAEDYLSKPFNPVLFNARVESSLDKKRLNDIEKEYRFHLEDRVRQQVKDISSAQLSAIFAMSKLAESRDDDTGAHLERIREYCKIISIHLQKIEKYKDIIGREFINNIYAASPLHDIGKISVPDGILKKPAKLNVDEWVFMKAHTTIGAKMLRDVNKEHPGNTFIKTGIEISESHHEKWNGKGYPFGLKHNNIPLVARILSLADVYDALTSKRCYKEAHSHEKSKGFILDSSGESFDPEIVECFVNAEGEFIRVHNYYKVLIK